MEESEAEPTAEHVMLPVIYSATVWDGGESGVGVYLREHLRTLGRRVVAVEHGGRVLGAGEQPGTTSTGRGTSRLVGPIVDILWHRGKASSLAESVEARLVHSPTIRRIPKSSRRVASTVTVHDTAPLRFAGKYGLLRGIFHRHFVSRWLQGVDAVITPSKFTKGDVIRFYGVPEPKVTVVPNGIDHNVFRPGDIDDARLRIEHGYGIKRPFLVYVARLEHPAKNHVTLIEAYRRLRDSGIEKLPDLVFVGSPWHGSEAIEEAGKDLIVAGVLHLVGRVPWEDIPRFFHASIASIYPSLFEGFGLPVVEAMACGTPVACSSGSSLGEVAAGNALTFEPESIEEMCEAMTRLVTDAGLRARLTKSGLDHAATFTWENSVEQTVAVWERVLAQRASE